MSAINDLFYSELQQLSALHADWLPARRLAGSDQPAGNDRTASRVKQVLARAV
jgi:hypothetical protein